MYEKSYQNGEILIAIGYLRVIAMDDESKRIAGAQVIVQHENKDLVTVATGTNGSTTLLSLETVDKEFSLKSNPSQQPFYIYHARITKNGYEEEWRDDVTIFDGQTSMLYVTLTPIGKQKVILTKIPDANMAQSENKLRDDANRQAFPIVSLAETPVHPSPIIPYTISVKLGEPQSNANVILVDYIYYIKNVASSEIFPTWPIEALKANVYAIQSLAMNRIYTEWYRQRGYPFQITASTLFDQKFIPDRVIYDNIATIVDNTFKEYVQKTGFVEPVFTEFCDGQKVKCNGLHQWETVNYAQQGLSALEILKKYYGDDISIVTSAIIQDIAKGFIKPLELGDTGDQVLLMELYLLRISVSYPAIPQLFPFKGVFDKEFQNIVKAFQKVFNLPVTGIIDESTWYKISFVYHAVKRLAELKSEGLISPIDYGTFTQEFKMGDEGTKVLVIQYALNVIASHIPGITQYVMDAKFGPNTKKNIEAFQKYIGYPVTGIVDRKTWDTLYRYYVETWQQLPVSFELLEYPGQALTIGARGENVHTLQQYLNMISKSFKTIPEVNISGVFDEATAQQVREFQREYNIPQTGIVDERTWNQILKIYKAVLPVVLYPGTPIQLNETSYYAAVIQTYLNAINKTYPNIPTSVVDTLYGPQSQASVLAFQRQFNLPDTGILDKQTWNKILEVYTELYFIGKTS